MIYLFLFLGLFLGLNLIGDNLIFFALISIALLLFTFKRFNSKVTLYFLLALTLGVGLSLINLKLNPSSGTYTGIVIESKNNYYIVWSKFERFIVYENNNSREVGDVIKITGNITDLVDTSLESEFSFVKFLSNKGITRQINITNIEISFSNFIKLKAYKTKFLSLFDDSVRDYVDMFLFNVKNYDNSSIALASSMNLSYLFSTSGIYLAIIFRIVEYFLFLKLDEQKSKAGSLIVLSWYLVFTLNKVGIRRLIYVKVFSLINNTKLKRKFTYLEVVSLVGITMLLVNHYLARQSAFYLGILVAYAFIFTRSTLARGKKKQIISKTSVFAFLFMLPVSLFSSNTFHPCGFIIQMIFNPMCFVFMLVSIISFYSYPVKPVFNFMYTVINRSLNGFSYINIKLPFREFTLGFVILYYFLLFLSIYFIEGYQYQRLFKSSFVLVTLLAIKIIPVNYYYVNSITFLNVGQGDSALIRNKNINVLVDTGGLTYKDVATESTIPYLRKQGIYQIDYVFISHQDNDHVGALESLKNNFKVNEVIDTSSPFKITIGDMVFENINQWADSFEDENDKSQVLKFNIANRNILMMGDASTNIENKIMEAYTKSDFDIDVMKIGHHGSKTSSSYEFLNFVSPKEAVISVGKNNKYGHPNSEVIANLKALKIPYKRTDEIGSIHYYKNIYLEQYFHI